MSEETTILINKALEKIKSKEENNLCKYLPEKSGKWRIHHFALKKMKKENPSQFKKLINEFIIDSSSLRVLDSKPRASRTSSKAKNMQFSHAMLRRIAKMANEHNDKELLAQIRPNLSLSALKKEFMDAIRNNEIDEQLWEAYKDAVRSKKQESAAVA